MDQLAEFLNTVGFPVATAIAFFFICLNMYKMQQKLLNEFQMTIRDNTEIIKDNTETTKFLLQELRYKKLVNINIGETTDGTSV